MRNLFRIVVSLFCIAAGSAAAVPKFELKEGDRVAFVGGVFMERELEGGYIETALALSAGTNAVAFRNFGWGGDVVETHIAPKVPARPKYVPDLFAYLEKYKPTVVFVSYGMMESFRGDAGLAEFSANYAKLLERISAISKPRIVMVSPFRHEQLKEHFPNAAGHNRQLQSYVEASRKLAEQRGINFVDLFRNLSVVPQGRKQLTSNGVHLDSAGYKAAAGVILKALELPSGKAKSKDAESIRTAIQHKNWQWWFHYRPMNSEYVYPGGTRYQNDLGGIKHPMYSEIEAFAALTEKEEKEIQTACKDLTSGSRKSGTIPINKTESVAGIPDPKVDPEAERKSFTMADGFQANLFAADPKISKPVQMAFDQSGRLWVATTTLYPQIKPGEEKSDQIIILEDEDGDGRAEKTTVFADGLVIPTGVLPYQDGAFVFDDTTLLFLRDTDGDGRADKREVVLSGFGTEDSHHKGHTLRWGPEGRLHFNVGVFLHNNIETAHGIVSMSGYWQPGIFAYDPASGRLDIHLANSVPPNPWGHYWNRWGFDHFIDSSGQQGSSFILPTSGRSSSAMPVPGGEGKLAGGEIISGRHFPESWHGRLISAPFKENRVASWEFSDDGSGYGMKPSSPLIVSTDSSFRPVDERMGPDGAIYISDWYNPLIGHMQHHFRDPNRDFTHGRIWRITAKDRPLVTRPSVAKASVKQLLEHLKAPEDYTRQQARRALAERTAKDVIPALNSWVKNLNTNDLGFDHNRIEALWVYQSLKVPEPTLVKSVLQSKDGNARAAATVILRDWRDGIPETISLLAGLAKDEFPRVRLQAVIAASYIADIRSVEAAMGVLDFPMDRYLDQALKNTIVALKPTWESALAGDKMLFGGDAKRLSFLVKNAALESDPKVLIHLLRAKQVAPENLEKTITAIVNNGTKADLDKLFVQDFVPEIQAKVLEGLTRAARERQIVLNAQSQSQLGTYLKHDHEALRAAALKLAGAWKIEPLRAQIETAARNEKEPATIRKSAFEGMAYLGGDSSKAFFAESLRQEKNAEIRQALLGSLVEMDISTAAQTTANILSNPVHENEIPPLLQPFLARKNGTDVLAGAISKAPIHADSAKVALRFLQKTAREDKTLVAALNASAGSASEPKELSRQELTTLATEVLAKGDATRGEAVFRRNELSCFQCHAISGAGGSLGPDLSAIGSGSQMDYLIESLLHPNKIVKDGFETVEIVTTDDEYVVGIKVRENAKETVLKDAARTEFVVPASSIKEQKHKAVSLMPAGLTAGLTHSEFLDLCRFLSELGKPGPYANNPNALIRRWQVAMPLVETDVASANATPWSPVYSTVSGLLPLQELTSGTTNKVWLRTEFEVTTPGKIQFSVNGVDGLTLYLNGKAASLDPTTILELERGRQTVLFEVDTKKRQSGLRMELEQTTGSPGRFQLVTGR